MTKRPAVTLDDLFDSIRSYFPDADLDIVRKAHDFAERVHGDQKRHSGEPYMQHPREVTKILTEMRLDIPTICTGLLHDTVEDTHATLDTIESEFGPVVATLVDGVTKLSKITFKTSEEKQAENFRKMIIAMAKDIRVVLVKLADRTHNMRTLEHVQPYKQRQVAQETLDIYAPIANRLGISTIKIELEDLCLKYLHPDIYYKLASQVSRSKKERDQYIEEISANILERLKEYDMTATVTGRSKHFYSIFKKMERRNIDFEQVHDLIAFRIVVDNITECYKALGIIHAAYKPVPGRFKDYIAMPKANKYQSLHTTVISTKGDRIEIQIRTQDMHNVAEMGIAAHWKYKEGRFSGADKEAVEWVDRLLEWHRDLKDPSEFLETVKTDLFEDAVYIFTPRGDVQELPFGSTPLDFAFSIHSDLGIRSVGAKVNGKIVPLRYRLKSGDTVEILTSPTAKPSKDWLKLVKTSKAKARIRAYIKLQERSRALEMGRDMLDRELRLYGEDSKRFLSPQGPLLKFAESKGLKSVDDLLVYVGYGRLSAPSVINNTLPKEVLARRDDRKAQSTEGGGLLTRLLKTATKKNGGTHAIVVGGMDDILVRFGRCCGPIPGDNIVGFVSRGRGVTVHTTVCPKALEMDDERRIAVEWDLRTPMKRPVKIKVLSHDTPGLLATMSQAITGSGVNIVKADVRTTKDKKAICHFDIEVSSTDELTRTIGALEARKGVINVERVRE
jgi:GTP pyrophosphokinase